MAVSPELFSSSEMEANIAVCGGAGIPMHGRRQAAVIEEIRDEGRAGRLRFLDCEQTQWVFWAQFHNKGKWLAMGMRELSATRGKSFRHFDL